MLGWDITDFGLGNFYNCGFGLITLRNGNQKKDGYQKTYAEKLLYMHDYMYAAMHYHDYKSEDIINRGGGILEIKVYLDDGKGGLSMRDVPIQSDGHRYTVPAGSMVRLEPGQSITIYPHLYHEFHVVKGSGNVLIGEVSMCNDDENDNFFYDQNTGRFPAIEEDEAPYRLLCNEYPLAKG